MLINCDLGESFGSWTMGQDAAVMPFIDQANIACGFHAGDPVTMRHTLALAAAHGVAVGAHPAYPDLVGFGRRAMMLSAEQIIANVHYQIAALAGMARSQGLDISYVKPHGALYHDMMAKPDVRTAIFQAIAGYHQPLPLMVQATAHAPSHRAEARAAGIELLFEAFADRGYADDGNLLPRGHAGAVHKREAMLAQVTQLVADRTVTTASGKILLMQVDTLCIHGDNPEAVRAVEAIRTIVKRG